MQPTYTLHRPVRHVTPVIFASPHSGRRYPATFLERSTLDEWQIRSSEDAFVDLLFAAVPSLGAPLIAADVPRAYVDLNRSSEELDSALIEGVRKNLHNPRVSSGLGVIPRVVANGQAIYRGKLSRDEAEARITDHWMPYHSALKTLFSESRNRFGEAVLIDCHSMPHEALDGGVQRDGRRPEIVLGDRFGAAASAEVMDWVEAAFRHAGFVVARNTPFAGAYSTQRYGRPGQRQHVIQVEIDRALYMDERTVRPNDRFEEIRSRLTVVAAEITQIGRAAQKMAAE